MRPTPCLPRELRTLKRISLRVLLPACLVAAVPWIAAGAPAGAQASSGVSWSVDVSPATSSTENNGLSGVSCVGSTFCAAVGTVNESWNGSTWSIDPSPTTDDMNAVSCTGPSTCLAVGAAADEAGSEAWNGSTWSSVPTGLAGTDSTLQAVSCTGPSACMAVGIDDPENTCGPKPPCDQIFQATLTESWNGSAWSVVPSPDAPSYLSDDLTGVSCTGPSACFAVGYAGEGAGSEALIESWNGSVWSIVPSPNPNTSGDQTVALAAVSCSNSTACVAAGEYAVDGLYSETLVEMWNGSAWSIVPSPDTSSLESDTLTGVSCSAPSACTAVGGYGNGSEDLTLMESWNGSTWSIVPSPNGSNTRYNSILALSCTGASACAAVGTCAPNAFSGNGQPLIESSAGISDGEAPVITSANRTAFQTGLSGTFTVTSGGTPLAFLSEAGALPSGLTFLDNGDGTATLSGTPAAGSAGTYPITITAGDGVPPDATQSFTLTVETPPPTTSVLIPANGATLSGTAATLDAAASNATSVVFALFGGTYGLNGHVVGTATPTIYGWLDSWDTTTVANGSYVLISYATGPGGSTASTGVGVTVRN